MIFQISVSDSSKENLRFFAKIFVTIGFSYSLKKSEKFFFKKMRILSREITLPQKKIPACLDNRSPLG
jgi:hypothetical protein